MNLNKLFLSYCKINNLEINPNQLGSIDELNLFYNQNFNKSLLKKIFTKQNYKTGFYLQGDVGVGKTMILNFFYNKFDKTKQRFHFNEFMISFHDFVFKNKENKQENIIDRFVKKLKSKSKLIYFDEFQVTNIVDAMILGSLFKKIFDENIKVLFSSNTKINDLYKDGLQRDQFLPFIKIMKERSYETQLIIQDDYRKSVKNRNERYFYPLNESTNFKLNKFFRKITKNLTNQEMILSIKGRKLTIKNYFNGIARFDFKELCSKNIGAEDYIKITEVCNFIVIENIPIFNSDNSNQQQRFITLIDILYEKNIPLMITSQLQLDLLSSSEDLKKIFKRTISRLYELTSIKYTKL
ncbi:cell division protein ZapE [Candidatus Pelagibacter ubique]|jgi:cell division protein ZapE|nr:cell division protein ZapE [Candidatus Pelagibacter bacterium]MDA7468144.1 cell division protein ZapE [Candidatus Pelagibacter ubique]MDA8988172.1 cell division protein ZapE [Candidatus Pelagibacter ubique]MDB9740557.1 cell division protein ZapE [Candidatus Pelagibacter ubique]MDC1178669.1 cell division protein ZapE [Candidatus Pelagibacter ubique]